MTISSDSNVDGVAEFVDSHPLLAALVEHERVRTHGYIEFHHGQNTSQLRQLFEMCGIETRVRITGIKMERLGDAKVQAVTVAPEWAVRIGEIVTRLLGGSLWQETLDAHKLVLLLRKAQRDTVLRKELDAVPRLVGNDRKAREAMRDVLDEFAVKYLAVGDV